MFREIMTESSKMRTKNGFEYPIAKVKKVQKFADTIDMSDSRVIAGDILDWCKLNKVKIDVLMKKVQDGGIEKSVAKAAFMGSNMRKLTPSGQKLLDVISEV